jgi:cytochrome c553
MLETVKLCLNTPPIWPVHLAVQANCTPKVNGAWAWFPAIWLGCALLAGQAWAANFLAPAGKVLYFEALDADFNELQRMRSVVQLHPGETRGCVGCHEDRMTAPPHQQSLLLALQRPPRPLQPPPWGAGPFAYEQVVQPVWDAHCVRCHDARDKDRINLAGLRLPSRAARPGANPGE